jgi:hypothetical protein
MFVTNFYQFPSNSEQVGPPSGNMMAWWKADAGVSTSEGSVTQWADQSGNARHLTPGSSPTLASSVINGQPALSFTEGNKLEVSGGVSVTSPFSYVVIAYSTTDISTRSTTIISSYDTSFNGQLYLGDGNRVQMYNDGNWISSFIDTPVTNNWLKIYNIFDGASSSMYVNNDALNPQTGTMATTGFSGWSVGGPFYGGDFAGYIAEIIIYNKALDSTDRSQLNSYFSSKYGL